MEIFEKLRSRSIVVSVDMEDIDLLVDLPKSEIEYNKFDKLSLIIHEQLKLLMSDCRCL